MREYARTLMRQTTYWVFDEESGGFGPSKHVGLKDMSLEYYSREGYSEIDGTTTRKAIARALEREYYPCPELHSRLRNWGDALIGRGAFDGIASSKWVFVQVGEASIDPGEFESQVQKYSQRTLPELLRMQKEGRRGVRKASVRVVVAEYSRSPITVAIARKRAGGRCEIPGCTTPPFTMKNGVKYVEVHHIITLAEGGPDVPENVACLCPNHHREIHHGKNSAMLRATLQRVRSG